MNTPTQTPASTVEQLMHSLNNADIDSAIQLYEPDAVFFPEPGRHVKGHAAIREELTTLLSLRVHLSAASFRVSSTDTIAQYCANWSLTGVSPDGTPLSLKGASSDVLRKQSNGQWLIAIDNPYVPEILDAGN